MIGIIKTSDLRNEYLVTNLNASDYIYSDRLDDFYNLKYLIIPPMGIDNNYYFKNSCISLLNIYAANPGITKIFCILLQENLKEFCNNNNIEIICLLEKEDFIYENALLTSEGLFRVMVTDLDESLSDLNILVLGFGYCANAILKHLSAFTKGISVYSKDNQELKSIYLSNYKKVKKLESLEGYDIIINTIPYNIIKKDLLKTIKNKCLIYDIASYPYGFDLDEARELNVKINIIPQIPGRMMPKSAGKLIFENIKQYIC